MNDKLRAAAQAVLKSTKSLAVCCEDFNHRRKDLHRDDQKCQPLGRYNDALTDLEAALEEPAIKESLTVAEPEEKLLSIHRLDQWLKAALAEQKPMLEMNPQKREWVGLTDDEIEDLNKDQTLWEIIRAAEEILREKNT